MKIRSITYFCDPGWPLEEKRLRAAGEFLKEARAAFAEAGYEVQTTRLATIPFPRLLSGRVDETPSFAQTLSRLLPEIGAEYASLGPALPEAPESYAIIPEALAASEKIFFSGWMADSRTGLSLGAARRCAEIIVRNATIQPNGFANLNFCASANVPPGVPFFPAAYHQGREPVFALAMECADAAVAAFEGADTVERGRLALVEALESSACQLQKTVDYLKYKFMLHFGGMDYSLAPFPQEIRSLGAAFERLGVPAVGLHGSLAAAAVLAEALDRARFPRAGFCGLMMPVLEDAVLARRAAEGVLSVKDLLLYSAVCGAGLDTLPLPGNVTVEQVTALLLDLAALALRLEKPLTARLMPVPGKEAGAEVTFAFEYFASSRVLGLEADALQGPLAGDEVFLLKPRG